MNRTLAARLDRLDQARADREPIAPGLVLIPDLDNGGFIGLGRHYPTVEQAIDAHPNRTGPLVVVQVASSRRPRGVDHAA